MTARSGVDLGGPRSVLFPLVYGSTIGDSQISCLSTGATSCQHGVKWTDIDTDCMFCLCSVIPEQLRIRSRGKLEFYTRRHSRLPEKYCRAPKCSGGSRVSSGRDGSGLRDSNFGVAFFSAKITKHEILRVLLTDSTSVRNEK